MKVPLQNNNPPYESFTFGHPNPVARTVPNDAKNLPMLTSIEDTSDGYFTGAGGHKSLGHMFMPCSTAWNAGDIVRGTDHY